MAAKAFVEIEKEGVSGEKAPLFSTLVQSPLSGQDQYFSVCFSCRILISSKQLACLN